MNCGSLQTLESGGRTGRLVVVVVDEVDLLPELEPEPSSMGRDVVVVVIVVDGISGGSKLSITELIMVISGFFILWQSAR